MRRQFVSHFSTIISQILFFLFRHLKVEFRFYYVLGGFTPPVQRLSGYILLATYKEFVFKFWVSLAMMFYKCDPEWIIFCTGANACNVQRSLTVTYMWFQSGSNNFNLSSFMT